MTQRHRGMQCSPFARFPGWSPRWFWPSFVCAPADARKRQHHHRAKAPIARTMAPAPRTIAPDARTTSNYDGNWSVLIVTNSGQCDRGYRYGVTIRGGRVSYEGGAAVNVQGAVSGNGAVQVRLSAGHKVPQGAGAWAATPGRHLARHRFVGVVQRHLDGRTARLAQA